MAAMTQEEQHEWVADRVYGSLSHSGEAMSLYREVDGRPNTGYYSDNLKWSAVQDRPVVLDLNLQQLDHDASVGGLIRLSASQSAISAAMETGEGASPQRHLLKHVQPETVANNRRNDWFSACTRTGRNWRTPTEDDPYDWCQECLTNARGNGWRIEVMTGPPEPLDERVKTFEQIQSGVKKAVALIREKLAKVDV
jgi:hypothetical protein